MSDYLVTDAELTETADAIRAKTGESAAIEWESGTGFADAVAAIPSGGGGGNAHYQSLTVTNTVDRNWIRASHNLGVVPKIVRVMSNTPVATVPDDLAAGEVFFALYTNPRFSTATVSEVCVGFKNAASLRWSSGWGTINSHAISGNDYVWDNTYYSDTEIQLSAGFSNALFLAGVTYTIELWG